MKALAIQLSSILLVAAMSPGPCAVGWEPRETSNSKDKAVTETGTGELPRTAAGDVDHLAFRCVERRNNRQLRVMMEQGVPANLRSADGTTLLMYAALHGNAEGVQILLDAGADPNAKNDRGETPLIWGAPDVKKVQLLVEAGANIDAISANKATPLSTAAGHIEGAASVAYLLTAGASSSEEPGRVSPLFAAAEIGGLETIRVLLEHYREKDYSKADIELALKWAMFLGHQETAIYLLQWDGPGGLIRTDAELDSILDAALAHPFPKLSALLIDRGVSAKSLLSAASSDFEDVEAVRTLIARGADCNATDDAGLTALDHVKLRGHRDLEKVLIDAGATSKRRLTQRSVPSNDIAVTDGELNDVITRAVGKSLDLLFRSSDWFLQNRRNCSSCHHQDLPIVAASIANNRGLEIPRHALSRILQRQSSMEEELSVNLYTNNPFVVETISLGYSLWGKSALALPASDFTKASVSRLAAAQSPDGGVRSVETRTPLQSGAHQDTALAILAFRMYPLVGREDEFDERIRRATRWLERTPARTHTDQTFRLLGLAWGETRAEAVDQVIVELLQSQKKDGGWSQLINLDSDAWATGMALLAMHAASVDTKHPAYKRGIRYLLNTQFEDGSWFVKSRIAAPMLQHFDSKFPFGKDQWISAAGTAVATASLALALEPVEGQAWVPSPTDKTGATEQELLAAASNQFSFGGIRTIEFERDIRPIFEQSCIDCHSTAESKGNFRIVDRDSFMSGGQSGVPPVWRGQGAVSRLVRHVTGQIEDMEMPPLDERDSYPALTPMQVATLTHWINEGADWPDGVVLGE